MYVCVLGCCQPFGIQVLCRSCFKLRLLTPFFYDCFMYCAIKTKIMANRKYKHTHKHILPCIHTHLPSHSHTEAKTHAICAAFGGLFHAANCNIGDLALYFVCNGAYTLLCECASVSVCFVVCLTVCVFIVRFFICILLGCVKAFKHIISIAEHNTKGLTLISTYDLCVPVSVSVSVCWCVCVYSHCSLYLEFVSFCSLQCV